MAISFDKAFGLHEAALKLRVERAGVLSSNLANADTPGYKARDIDFQSALQSQMNGKAGRMQASQSGHVNSANGARPEHEYIYRAPTQPSIDGNTVEENVEHAEFMKNNMEFQVAFQLLNSKFKGLSKAIRGE
ncbi:MAG: flagellar basal body rod protein FlgB [Agarilytica sp.]